MKSKGFTLFELLVMISIVGILLGLAMTSFSGAQKRARDARRKEDLQAVQKALEQYYALSGGNYPPSCFSSGSTISYEGTVLLQSFPTDPKNSGSYQYSCTSASNSGYCYCAFLESASGNATNNSCNWGSGNYFCISNRQ